jgi:hypothetical protein
MFPLTKPVLEKFWIPLSLIVLELRLQRRKLIGVG